MAASLTGRSRKAGVSSPKGLLERPVLGKGSTLPRRLVGRPGRTAALARFIDYVSGHDKVWVTRRIDIAWHWHAHHAP